MRAASALVSALAMLLAGCSLRDPAEGEGRSPVAGETGEFEPNWREGPADLTYRGRAVAAPAGTWFATDGETWLYAVSGPSALDTAMRERCREQGPGATATLRWVILDAASCSIAAHPSVSCSGTHVCEDALGAPRQTTPTELRSTCGNASLRVVEPVAWPDVRFVARLENCGKGPLEVHRPDCSYASGFAVLVTRGLNDFRVPEEGGAAFAPNVRYGCVLAVLTPPLVVPEGEAIEHEFAWNGTFASDPCHAPHQAEPPGACNRFAPAAGGSTHVATVDVIAGDEHHVAQALLRVPGASPTPPQDCRPLTLESDRDTLAQGSEARIVARLANCKSEDLTFGVTMVCDRAYGLKPVLRNATHAWDLDVPGSALTPHTRGCLSVAPPLRILFPGESVEFEARWNGTMTTCATEPALGCDARFEVAPSGEYEIGVRLESREGDAYEARQPLRVT